MISDDDREALDNIALLLSYLAEEDTPEIRRVSSYLGMYGSDIAGWFGEKPLRGKTLDVDKLVKQPFMTSRLCPITQTHTYYGIDLDKLTDWLCSEGFLTEEDVLYLRARHLLGQIQ